MLKIKYSKIIIIAYLLCVASTLCSEEISCAGSVRPLSGSALEASTQPVHITELQEGEYYQIEVLFLSTPESISLAGGIAAFQSEVSERVRIANQSLKNSGLKLLVKSLGIEESPISEQGDADEELLAIANSEAVQALRDQYEADVVAMLVSHTSNNKHCGLSFILDKMDENSNRWGYQITSFHSVCEDWVFTHELGHLLGGEHDPQTATQSGIYSYSHGHRLRLNESYYRTIMALEPGSVIEYFSSPSQEYQGVALGTEDSDNVRTIEATMGFVAAYRGEATTAAPIYDPELTLDLSSTKKQCNLSLKITDLPENSTLELYQSGKSTNKLKDLGTALPEQNISYPRQKKSLNLFIRLLNQSQSFDSAAAKCKRKKKK